MPQWFAIYSIVNSKYFWIAWIVLCVGLELNNEICGKKNDKSNSSSQQKKEERIFCTGYDVTMNCCVCFELEPFETFECKWEEDHASHS